MKKQILTLVCASAFIYAAAETPRWLREPAISPDGKTVAFTYKGDIYTVPVTGGNAARLTVNEAYDNAPVWSPDGKKIVFSSTREGSADIYVVDARGGKPRRLTTHSGNETPLTFINDSTLLFSANVRHSREAILGPNGAQAYTIDINRENPRPRLLVSTPMMAASSNAAGGLLYEDKKGFENRWRKHERSSGTSDIWLYKDNKFTKLTDFNGHDLNPIWSADGKQFYYISEQDGILNVYVSDLAGSRRQLTHSKTHPVRSLSASADGTLAFSLDGDLYTLRPGAEPVKIAVEIATDDYDSDRVKRYITGGADAIAVSPSGDEVAFVARGDIYVTSAKYKTTKRITDTPGQERGVSFSPDGRSLVYDSERDGRWQLFITSIVNDDEKQFAYATDLVEKPLYSSDKAAQWPDYSPDGKKVAFLEDRTTLRVIDLDTKAVNTALDGKYNYSYADGDVTFSWSPDSRWLLTSYIGVGGWNNSDIAIVRADGSEVVDLTESGYSDESPKWVLGGKGVTYTTGKYGMKSHGSWGNQDDIVIMMLDGEAWDEFNMTEEEAALAEKAKENKSDENKSDDKKDKKDKKSKKNKGKDAKADEDTVEPLDFDLANRKYRTRRLTGSSAIYGDYFLSPKGDKLYYVVRDSEGSYNLMCLDIRKGETKVLTHGVRGAFATDKKGEKLFVISGSGIKKIELPGGDSEQVEFEAPYSRTPSKEREYIYDHMLSQVKDKFYDVNLHGVAWDSLGAHYREFLPYINNNTDFAVLMSEVLGELNASHTGARYYGGGARMATADLGAFYDENYDGDGLKVAEVIARGPLSLKKAGVVAGDIITEIDGMPIVAGTDYFPLLEGKNGKKVRLTVHKADGSIEHPVVRPSSYLGDEVYSRWVERNEDLVDSLSNGRIGYVHIEGMDSPSFRTIYDRILGKYRNREAIIVDTRWNGGGWLHNDVALLLGGKEYVRFVPRGQYIGSEPFSQWTKPSVMLVNESNYSDAHGTPFVYQTLGLGKIVGAPVPGTMTAVWWESQIDPTLVFGIPQVTSIDMNGNVLENHQLNPDVVVYNNPADVLAGRDAQIEASVRTLLDQLDAKK